MIYIYTLEYPEGNVRYVGKAKDLNKRLQGHVSKIKERTHKNNWVRSLLSNGVKPIMKVIEELDETEDWAFWERFYIFQFRAWGFDLTNATFGGDGLSNVTSQLKNKLSNSLLKFYENGGTPWNKGLIGFNSGEKCYMFGKPKSEEVRAKISKAKLEFYKNNNTWNKGIKTGTAWNKGKVGVMPTPWNKDKKGVMPTPWNKGSKVSEECKEKWSTESVLNRKTLQFDTDGNFVNEFRSNAYAAKVLNIFSENISAASLGKSLSCGGFIWIYADEYSDELLANKVHLIKTMNERKSRGSLSDSPSAKKIIQLTLGGEKVKEFGSIKGAKMETGFSGIGKALLLEKPYRGFLWVYKV